MDEIISSRYLVFFFVSEKDVALKAKCGLVGCVGWKSLGGAMHRAPSMLKTYLRETQERPERS